MSEIYIMYQIECDGDSCGDCIAYDHRAGMCDTFAESVFNGQRCDDCLAAQDEAVMWMRDEEEEG